MNEILTVHPRQYRDAQVIAETFREGVPVIMNLSQMSEPDARRLIDFACGLPRASTARSSGSRTRCSCCRPSTSRSAASRARSRPRSRPASSVSRLAIVVRSSALRRSSSSVLGVFIRAHVGALRPRLVRALQPRWRPPGCDAGGRRSLLRGHRSADQGWSPGRDADPHRRSASLDFAWSIVLLVCLVLLYRGRTAPVRRRDGFPSSRSGNVTRSDVLWDSHLQGETQYLLER